YVTRGRRTQRKGDAPQNRVLLVGEIQGVPANAPNERATLAHGGAAPRHRRSRSPIEGSGSIDRCAWCGRRAMAGRDQGCRNESATAEANQSRSTERAALRSGAIRTADVLAIGHGECAASSNG